MEIRIYNNELFRKGVIEDHTSLIWTRKYFEPGNFELHCPLTSRNITYLSKGNLVSKADTVECGVIESLELNESFENKEIIAKGRFLSSYMDRRLVKGTFSYSGTVQKAMTDLLDSVTPIPLVEYRETRSFSDTITFQATMKNLLTLETNLAKSSGLGFRFCPDFNDKVIYFEIYAGIDRSVSQNANNRVIFSDDYGNLNSTKYQWNDQLLKTYAVVGGEGEGEQRKYVYVGSGEGLDLREIFVDAKDARSDDLSESEYENILMQRGYDALAENIASESFECDTNPNGNFVYKRDYDLGDVVTINKVDWGISIDKRITEIQEIYENAGITVTPTFGDPLPETVDWSNI